MGFFSNCFLFSNCFDYLLWVFLHNCVSQDHELLSSSNAFSAPAAHVARERFVNPLANFDDSVSSENNIKPSLVFY